MTLKQLLFTSGAALAMFGTTTLSTIVANADTAPAKTQTTANANKDQNSQNKSQNNANNNKANDNKAVNQSANTAKTTPAQSNAKQNASAANSTSQKNDSPAKTNPTTNNGSAASNTNKGQSAKTDPVKTTPAKVAAGNANSASATSFDQRAPRLTGTTYKTYNKGLSASVTADKDNSTLNYSVKTFESDGTASNKPAQLKIYKNGALYKTINASSGSTDGSLKVDKGTYSLRVYTSASTHYAGGLSIS